MSIQLIDKNHYEKLLFILDSAEKEIKIISPFIKDETANLLCAVLESNPEIKCTIITRFVRQEFVDRASSLNALQHLIKSGAKLYALQYLHTKLYLVDDRIAMLGSANFTMGGFKLNHELSILLDGEFGIISELHQYFDDTLSEMKSQEDSIITETLIKCERETIEKLMKNWTDKGTKYSFDKNCQHGAIISKVKKETESPTTDEIQVILNNGSNKADSNNIWLKFEGTAEERENPENQYWLFTPQRYPDGITCFPENKKPTGIREGDRIYLSVVTIDANGNNTPVIVGRCTSYGYKKENIANKEMLKEADWLERFPAFIQLKDVEYLTTAQKNGISLIHLLTTLGTDLYPTTVGTAKPYPELRMMHYRRSHMKITENAAKYIDTKFDELAKQYGTNRNPI